MIYYKKYGKAWYSIMLFIHLFSNRQIHYFLFSFLHYIIYPVFLRAIAKYRVDLIFLQSAEIRWMDTRTELLFGNFISASSPIYESVKHFDVLKYYLLCFISDSPMAFSSFYIQDLSLAICFREWWLYLSINKGWREK